jgi:hypothetical protein
MILSRSRAGRTMLGPTVLARCRLDDRQARLVAYGNSKNSRLPAYSWHRLCLRMLPAVRQGVVRNDHIEEGDEYAESEESAERDLPGC